MNKAIIIGRLTKDPEVRFTQTGNPMAIARFTVAVDRKTKDKDGHYETDFIPCVAFSKTAEFVDKYFKKGSKIVVTGRIQTGNYTNKEGQKVYTTEIMVDEVEFAESKAAESKSEGNNGFVDASGEDLPFN